jgi:TraX protein
VLNNYQIKLLAAILMLVDHIGAVFFPNVAIFRVVGRFSFPLFIWLLVEGEKHTRNFGQYCFRLLILGMVSQPVFQILFDSRSWNILFTLLLGLLCLRLVRLFPRWELLAWLIAGTIAQGLSLEYGAYGIGMIALIHHLRTSVLWWAGWMALHLSFSILMPAFASFQFPAILAPLLFRLANHQRGQKARWFYLFYPLHLLALWLLQVTKVWSLLH